MNTQIEITQNGTTTLATAGKYCDRNIDVNVDVLYADALLQGTIAGEYVNESITSLRYGAFAGCDQLTSISLPRCEQLAASRVFNGCANVTELDLPKLTTIADGAYAFYGMDKLREINLPSLTTITDGQYTFYKLANLQNINLPNLTTIGNGEYAFCGLERVKEISLPNLTTIKSFSYTFDKCKRAAKISLPQLGGATIGTVAFRDCYSLKTLVLGGAFNQLAATNAFAYVGTWIDEPMSIYVPDDLVETYKKATNWTAYADQIKPMSELEE